MSNFQEIFDANQDVSEDECVMAIYDASDLSLKEAQSEYRTLATIAGIIKTPQQKKVDWEDAVVDMDISTVEGVNAAKAVGADMDIGPTTVIKYLKTLATESGVELAITSVSRGPSKWPEIVAAFDKDEALNEEREIVVAKIAEIDEFEEKKANGYYNKLRKEFGWEQPASMASQLNDWFADNQEATKQEIVDKGVEIGMSEGSANYYVGVYKVVVELLEKIQSAE